jgi:hypothetical protein
MLHPPLHYVHPLCFREDFILFFYTIKHPPCDVVTVNSFLSFVTDHTIINFKPIPLTAVPATYTGNFLSLNQQLPL